jgi:20S proteasome alpha/beta subunit
MAAEEEEVSGFASKRKVQKLKLFTDKNWSLVFAGAGDAAIIDNAERRLTSWLKDQQDLSGDLLMDALDDVLGTIYSKYIDPDPKSDGISLVVGASCSDGLHLVSTVKRTPQFQESLACAGYGADVAYYLLDRLHNNDDDWVSGVKIAAFSLQEAKESTLYCGGDTHLFVLQSPPNPRWRDLGWGGSSELENSFVNLISDGLRQAILDVEFTAEICEEYCDEQHPEPYIFDPDDPNSVAENLRRSNSQTSEGKQ